MTTQQATAPTFPTHAIERQPVVSGKFPSADLDTLDMHEGSTAD